MCLHLVPLSAHKQTVQSHQSLLTAYQQAKQYYGGILRYGNGQFHKIVNVS